MVNVKEVFSQFCKERHAEDKGRNYDLLQEIYASTEFFDVSMQDNTTDKIQDVSIEMERAGNTIKGTFKTTEGINLPFQNNFIGYRDNICVFIREYAPDMITGSVYALPNRINCPFFISIYPDQIEMSLIYGSYTDMLKFNEKVFNVADQIATRLFKVLVIVIMDLNNLSHKAVAVDKPKNPNLCEYYRRKRKPTIKIPQRPIYYVLGDKNENTEHKFRNIRTIGELEYSHCFSVRGHWRRVNEGTLGKDRNGNYNVKGYTWVTEYVKGEGELSKRLRVIK